MENKILDEILYYYNYNEEGPILFDDSAYNLYLKLEVLFNALKKEIKKNLASEIEGKIDYLNSFDKILFSYYSDEKFKASKYFPKLHHLTGKIIIDASSIPILKSELCLPGYRPSDDHIFEEQDKFLEFVKNYLLNDLHLFVKKNIKQLSKLEGANFIHSLETKNSNSKTENTNQLTVNQAVILLDKLGVFADANFESKSNVSKSKIISLLTGRNQKNIKSAIEQLEIKPKDITPGYQSDLDKVQQLLDKMK